MTLPDTAKKAHGRSFPSRAFYPYSIRQLNRAAMDAVFLNEALGNKGKPVDPKTLLEHLRSEVLSGDKAAKDCAIKIFEATLTTRSEARTKAKGENSILIRMTHPRFGSAYTPVKTYGARHWVRMFLEGSGDKDLLGKIRTVAKDASQRPMNLLEKGLLEAMQIAQPVEPAASDDDEDDEEDVGNEVGSPALPGITSRFAELSRIRLQSWERSTKAPTDAEDALRDIMHLYEVFCWLYWVHMHDQAWRWIQAFRENRPANRELTRWAFGYEAERTTIEGREFGDTRKLFESRLYGGSIALNALFALHQATNITPAIWFDEVASMSSADRKKTVVKLDTWLHHYTDLVGDVEPRQGASSSVEEALVRIYDAITEHYSHVEKESGRFPQRVGYGFAMHLGSGESCRLIMDLGPGAKRGDTAMVDADLILLFARCLSLEGDRIRLQVVLQALADFGIRLDEYSQDAILSDFERRGLVQSLSDSGEAKYVKLQ